MFDEAAVLLEPATAAIPRRRSILIIDDDDGQVDALTFRLGKQGYRTYAAGSAGYGLQLAIDEQPDLILLDLRLPDGSGFDVCERLADDADTCCIPIIILSGMERPDIIRRSRAVGCQYYVRKPYDPNALLILIEQAINESQSW